MRRQIELLFYALHRVFPRFKFRRICKALGIKALRWQRDYALGRVEKLQAPAGRGVGKTTAVMLRLLMVYPGDNFDIMEIMLQDPDFRTDSLNLCMWYDREYKRMAETCYRARIPVTMRLNLYPLYDNYHGAGAKGGANEY